MNYKELGNSGVKISEITFGAWAAGGWMWGGTDHNDAVAAIKEAINLGVTSIDTAPVYGFGLSEQIVGEAIKGQRDKVQLLTKFGLNWKNTNGQFFFESRDNQGENIDIYRYSSKENVIKECEDSLKRLGTDYIDLYQMHWPDPTTPINETMEALDKLMKDGKIRAAGVSNYSAEQMTEAEKIVTISSNQVPYSMLQRSIEDDVVPYCIENNKAILAYSPLQRGLLTGKIKQNHHFEEGDTRPNSPYYKEPNLSRTLEFLEKIEPLAKQKNITVAQMVVKWTLERPGITAVLVGARNPKQATENAKADYVELSAEETALINNYLEQVKIFDKL